jgi:dsRNA-specific ribonuclease
LLQSRGQRPPTYQTADARGPAHARFYRVVLHVDDQPLSEAEGRSKLEAEQLAAELALLKLGIAPPVAVVEPAAVEPAAVEPDTTG